MTHLQTLISRSLCLALAWTGSAYAQGYRPAITLSSQNYAYKATAATVKDVKFSDLTYPLGDENVTLKNGAYDRAAEGKLDGTSVTIGGQKAFIDYISPTQVNAQVPSTVGTGSQPVAVTTSAGASTPFSITVNLEQPGMLAPSSFLVGWKRYAVALFSDGVTYVLPPSAIPGLASRRAKVGDSITLYGVGFGTVTPAIAAGQVVQQTNSLTAPFHLLFGQTEATVSYAGLAPNAMGCINSEW